MFTNPVRTGSVKALLEILRCLNKILNLTIRNSIRSDVASANLIIRDRVAKRLVGRSQVRLSSTIIMSRLKQTLRPTPNLRCSHRYGGSQFSN
jgi:hypothetical protein